MEAVETHEFSLFPESRRKALTELRTIFEYNKYDGGPEPINVLTGEEDLETSDAVKSIDKYAKEACLLSGLDGEGVTDRKFAILKGKQFEVVLANDPIKPGGAHSAQDSVAGAIGVYEENGQLNEIAVGVIADGVSKGHLADGTEGLLPKSGKVSAVVAKEGVRSVMEQISKTGGYNLEKTYSDILGALKDKELSLTDGASTFTLLVAFNSSNEPGTAEVNIHPLCSGKDNGMMYKKENGYLSHQHYGGPVPRYLVPGGDEARLAKYHEHGDLVGQILGKGDLVALTSDGEFDSFDDLSGIKILFKG